MTLPPYPEYQPSGVDWLGDIPRHWEVHPHRNLFTEVIERGYPDEEMLSVTISQGVMRQAQLLANSSKKDSSNTDKSNYKLVSQGDIAYNKMRAWQGAIGASAYRGIISPAYIIVRLREAQHHIWYFHYLFRTPLFTTEAERWSYGITSDQWSLRYGEFKQIYSPLPPPDEQAAIVRFLDAAETRIRRYIRAKQKLIRLLNEQKQAIIQQAVTRGLNPDAPMKDSGVEWLGEIPSHWGIWKIGHLARLGNGSTPSRSNQLYWSNGTYPWLNSSSVNQEYIASAKQFVTTVALKECHLPIVPAGSLLVAITGQGKTRGTVSLLLFEATINQHMAYIVPDLNHVSGEFLRLFLKGMYSVLRFVSESSGSTRAALTVQDLKDFKVLVPPLAEQQDIVQSVKQNTFSIDEILTHAQNQIDLIREYRTCLIADVVTGKVDVRGLAFDLPEEFHEDDGYLDDDELLDDSLLDDDELEGMDDAD